VATSKTPMRKIARIAYNSSRWNHPTGEARKSEAPGTYNYENGFGHEDWLFRSDWLLNGWRYGFIQGVNRSRLRNQGPIDLTVYTIEPKKGPRFVANIHNLEFLSDEQAKDAVDSFRKSGWLKIMQNEVKEVDGKAEALGDPQWVKEILNVRFRWDEVDFFPENSFAESNDQWLKNRHRYQLYDFKDVDTERVEKTLRVRLGSQVLPKIRPIFRRGSHGIVYTPEHLKMQAKLLEKLQKVYGKEQVLVEQNFVDATVQTAKEIILYEIKTDLEPKSVIRHALGQILEYAYYPPRKNNLPTRLVIVGRSELKPADKEYLKFLKDECLLQLEYEVITLE
jgi:hypothetical protein